MVTLSAKEKILKLLKRGNNYSTSRIANESKIDYNYAVKLINELRNEGFIITETKEKFVNHHSYNSDRRKDV